MPAGASPRLTRACDVAAGAIAVAMLLSVVYMSRKPVTWPEDAFSDMNTLLAGENFARYGLVDLRFLPLPYAAPDGLGPWRRYYTHYPPLPDVVNGAARKAGIDSLSGMRTVSGLFGIAGFLLIYLALRRAVSPLAGATALAFIAGSGSFWSYGVSVHQHPFNICFLGLFLAFFVRAMDPANRRKWPWVLCWSALMLASLSSFEFIMYAQVFAWVYALVLAQARKRWKGLSILASAPAAGVALHFLQNIWAMGWAGAWEDKLGYRQYGGENRWEALGKLPEMLSAHIQRCFQWPWYVLVLLAVVLAAVVLIHRDAAGQWRRTLALLAAASAAPWAWYSLMAAHAHHPHTVNQLIPAAMIAFGGSAAMVAGRLLKRGEPGSVRAPLVVAAVLLAVIAYGGQKAIRGRIGPKRLDDYSLIAKALGPTVFPPHSAVLFNVTPEAHLAYFLRDYATLCPRHELKFPGDLVRLDQCLPPGWSYSSYLCFPDNQDWLYNLLRTTCPGKALPISAQMAPGRWRQVVLFDITALHEPPDRRPPLPEQVRQAQIEDRFPIWLPPGFEQRLRQAEEQLRTDPAE